MENNESNQKNSAPAHRPRSPGRLDISFGRIPDGSRSPAHASELHRRGDVKRHADEEEDAHEPEELAILDLRHADFPEESRIRVDCFRAGKDLEIAEHVADHEADESDASDRHHDLLPDHRVPERDRTVTDSDFSGCCDAVKMNGRIQILCVFHRNFHPFWVLPSPSPSPAWRARVIRINPSNVFGSRTPSPIPMGEGWGEG